MSSNTKKGKRSVLLTLHDEDIFTTLLPEPEDPWEKRLTGKVVLFNDDGEIALIGNKLNTLFLLPGGVVNEDESILEGVVRECKAETGCGMRVTKELGATEEFRRRDAGHYTSHGYAALVTSYGLPALVDKEFDIGAYARWFSIEEAIKIFTLQEEKVRRGDVKFYNTCFNIIRDSLFIQLAHKAREE